MIILGVLGLALAAFSAAIFAVLFKTLWRTQRVDELGRLPGIGPKSAQRIAFHLLKLSPEDALRLAAAISSCSSSSGSRTVASAAQTA